MRAAKAIKNDQCGIFFGVGEAESAFDTIAPSPPDTALLNVRKPAPGAASDQNPFKTTAVNPSFQGFADARELHKIQQKRFLEASRRRRVLDPKVRTIGVDRQFLDKQIDERARAKELEAAADCWAHGQAVRQDKHAQALDRESALLARQRAADVQRYRDTFQKRQARSEWHLNDPRGCWDELPQRVSDDDPRCGPASLLRFGGEEDEAKGAAARREQQALLTRLLAQQVDERKIKAWVEHREDAARAAREEELYKKVFELEGTQRAFRKQATVANADFNKAYAAQKQRAAADAKEAEAALNKQEIAHHLGSAFLTEADTVRCDGRRTNQKGLSKEEMRSIYNQQAQQRAGVRARRIEELEARRIHEARGAQEKVMAAALERELHDERSLAARQVSLDNLRNLQDRCVREKARRRLSAPEVGEQYFEQFSTF